MNEHERTPTDEVREKVRALKDQLVRDFEADDPKAANETLKKIAALVKGPDANMSTRKTT